MDFLLRSVREADAPALSDLAFRAKASWNYPADWLHAWRAELTFTPEYLLHHRAHVAAVGETLVGVSVIEVHGLRGTLEHVWIDPDQQGRGIGRMLVWAALESAAAAGVCLVDVVGDPHAEAFYVKLGARRVGEQPAPMPGAPARTLPLLEFTL